MLLNALLFTFLNFCFTACVVQAQPPSYLPRLADPVEGGVEEAAANENRLPKDISVCNKEGSVAAKELFTSRCWFTAEKEDWGSGDKVLIFESSCRFSKANTWDGGYWWLEGDVLHLYWDLLQPRHMQLSLAGTSFESPQLVLKHPLHIEEPEASHRAPLKVYIAYGNAKSHPLYQTYTNFPQFKLQGCPHSTKPLLIFSNDPKTISSADISIFNLAGMVADIENKKPITGQWYPHGTKPKHATWVGLSRELAFINTAEKKKKTAMLDYVMDWRLDSDIPASFFHYHFFGTGSMRDWHMPPAAPANRSFTAVAFYSHCETHSKREKYIVELSKYFPIMMKGRCKGNDFTKGGEGPRTVGPMQPPEEFGIGPIERTGASARKLLASRRGRSKSSGKGSAKGAGKGKNEVAFVEPDRKMVGGYNATLGTIGIYKKHKFSVNFDSSRSPYWITEKVFQGMLGGAVALYMGGEKIDDYLPCKKCVLKLDDFESPKAMAKFMWEMVKDPAKYNEYHEWRNTPYNAALWPKFERVRLLGLETSMCRLANTVRPGSCPIHCATSSVKQFHQAAHRFPYRFW